VKKNIIIVLTALKNKEIKSRCVEDPRSKVSNFLTKLNLKYYSYRF